MSTSSLIRAEHFCNRFDLKAPILLAPMAGACPASLSIALANAPIQRALSAKLRAAALRDGDVQCMQAWAGQSASLAKAAPAGELLKTIWEETRALLA